MKEKEFPIIHETLYSFTLSGLNASSHRSNKCQKIVTLLAASVSNYYLSLSNTTLKDYK